LDETQHGQDHRTPDADLVVTRDEPHRKRRQAGQQQGADQCRLAPDPIAVMAED
jgi:hypothetical protein